MNTKPVPSRRAGSSALGILQKGWSQTTAVLFRRAGCLSDYFFWIAQHFQNLDRVGGYCRAGTNLVVKVNAVFIDHFGEVKALKFGRQSLSQFAVVRSRHHDCVAVGHVPKNRGCGGDSLGRIGSPQHLVNHTQCSRWLLCRFEHSQQPLCFGQVEALASQQIVRGCYRRQDMK